MSIPDSHSPCRRTTIPSEWRPPPRYLVHSHRPGSSVSSRVASGRRQLQCRVSLNVVAKRCELHSMSRHIQCRRHLRRASWRLSADNRAKHERTKVIAWLASALRETPDNPVEIRSQQRSTRVCSDEMPSFHTLATIITRFMRPRRILVEISSASTFNQPRLRIVAGRRSHEFNPVGSTGADFKFESFQPFFSACI